MHGSYLNRHNIHKPRTDYDMLYKYQESIVFIAPYILCWSNHGSTLAEQLSNVDLTMNQRWTSVC